MTDFTLTNKKHEYYLDTKYFKEYNIECATVGQIIDVLSQLDNNLPLVFASPKTNIVHPSKLIIKQGECYILLDKRQNGIGDG